MFDDERRPQNPGGDRQETPGRGKPHPQDTGNRPGRGGPGGGREEMPGRGSQDQPDKGRGTPGNPRPEDRDREEEEH